MFESERSQRATAGVEAHARILWALPVTAAEMAHRREHGHEALERLFDEHAIVPTDPRRPSVA
ncbi:suppressor of fused domain protein [Streptomyces sp. NPDC093252]|uniref:suppressor of fused domain protein n=1 Tax=Streptomyces sp. NPDC093252 TaxID=3154980 RepID=UPI0034263400